jgi:uncharacterized protein (DUF433 family)
MRFHRLRQSNHGIDESVDVCLRQSRFQTVLDPPANRLFKGKSDGERQPDPAPPCGQKNGCRSGGLRIAATTTSVSRVRRDYLEGGDTLEEFLEGFPTVPRELALAALEEAKQLLLARV